MFKKLERRKVFLKLGLMGPSGSGKTYSAILLAKGLAQGGKIAAIDTENGSLSLYTNLAEIDGVELAPPFEPKKAVEAIHAAAKAGYSVLIIDSMTHFWKWILDYKEALDRQGGNSYTNWGKAKPHFDALKEALLQAPLHVICCMRAKDEYVIEKNDRGKDAPRKVGMGAILEPGAEYEYTTVFELGMDHTATASKDRTAMFDGEFFRITEGTGQRFLEWLEGGSGEAPVSPVPVRVLTNEEKITSFKLSGDQAKTLKAAFPDAAAFKGWVVSQYDTGARTFDQLRDALPQLKQAA